MRKGWVDRVAMAAAVVLCTACETHGLVGSNASAESSTSGGDEGGGSTSGGGPTSASGGGDSASAADDAATTDDTRFDVAIDDLPTVCADPMPYAPCDGTGDDDPWHAIGVNCEGGPSLAGTTAGAPESRYTHHGMLGTSGEYTPREGDAFVVLSTGLAQQLRLTPQDLVDAGCIDPVQCPSTWLDTVAVPMLPAPIDVRKVDERLTCTDDPSLIGTGDCSNSLWAQWLAGTGAYDYTELRLTATVPNNMNGLSYDFAFFSTEYPLWVDHASPFNDLYLAWLQSELWTGNVAFDELGNPIGVQGVFLDYKDAPSASCPEPCEAPELAGFAMEGHAGTKWLQNTAPVLEGETIELVLALFDMSDGVYDSMVILDNFDWTCVDAPPVVTPAG
jgi:hypothetical protein